MKKRSEMMELPVEVAVPCKLKTESSFLHREICSESNKIPKSKLACFVEAHESTGKRLERTL